MIGVVGDVRQYGVESNPDPAVYVPLPIGNGDGSSPLRCRAVSIDSHSRNAMTSALGTPGLGDQDRLHLDFALGKAMHDLGRTDQAFGHYARANALRRQRQS